MATFAAPPMTYRNFAPSQPAPTDAGPPGEPEVADADPAMADPAAAFPLLNAALPGIIQFPMPRTAAAGMAVSDQPPQSPILHLATRDAKEPEAALDRLIASPKTLPASDPSIAPQSSAVATPRLPCSKAQVSRALRQDQTALASTRDHATPLKTLFGILRGASPARGERTATTLGLQNLFRRL